MFKVFNRDREFYNKLLAIAIPITLQSLITIGVNMADTMMLGSLGEISLSGAALANQFAFIFMIVHFGLAGGAGVLTGQFWGKGDKESINKTLSIMFKISAVMCIVFFILGQFIPEKIMRIYTPEAGVIVEGARYLKILSISFLFQGLSLIAIGILRTVGVVKLTLVSTAISFLVNIFLNWVFIFGNLGAPRLGTAGAAVGTLMARIIEFIIVFVYLLFIDKKIQFKVKSLLKTDMRILKDYFRHGTPVLVSDGILALGVNVIAIIMGRMGSDMVAANSINSVLQQFSTVFLFGVANASGVIIGNTVGSKEYKKAQEYGITFMSISILIGIVSGILILLLRDFMMSFYNVTEGTKEIAYSLMNVTSILVIFFSLSATLTKGVLRAGGDTKFLMVADVLFLWIVAIPLGFITGVLLKWPPGIVFVFLRIDEVIKGLWCVKRLLFNRWIKNVTIEERYTKSNEVEILNCES